MPTRRRSLLLILPLSLAPALALDGRARAGGGDVPGAARRPAAADVEVDIVNANGATRIIGWDRPEVAVSGRSGKAPEDLQLSGEGKRIRIRLGDPDDPFGGTSSLEVRVPRGSRVKMRSFNARISAENLTGSLRAESFEGSLQVSRGPAEVSLKSTSGSIEVQAAATRTEVETVNGSIRLRDVGGQLKARTVNGSITVEGQRFDQVKLSTVSGRLRFEGAVNPRGHLEARSVNGSVELRLPRDTSGSFVLGSANGRLESDFHPGGGGRDDGHEGDRKLSFTVGSGGAQIEARSVNGSVSIQKR
jgi:hypothetical protein